MPDINIRALCDEALALDAKASFPWPCSKADMVEPHNLAFAVHARALLPILARAWIEEREAREKIEAAGATLRETLALFGGPPVCVACGDVSVRGHESDCPIGHALASDVGELLLVRLAAAEERAACKGGGVPHV